MSPTLTLTFLLAATAANHCHAQESVSHSWTYSEVIAGTNTPVPFPNGLIEPGEGVRFSLTVTVTPEIGSTATYTPPPPPGTGTIAGLGSIFIDLRCTTSAAGTWNSIARPAAWALGDPGSPQPSAGVFNIQAGQFVLTGQTANSQNPVPGIWSAVWNPASYTPRDAIFFSAPAFIHGISSILIQYGNDPGTGAPWYVAKFVGSQHGQVRIPIVPAPGAAPLLLIITAHHVRRRRSQISTEMAFEKA